MSRRVSQRAVSTSLIVSALLLSAGLTACGKTETSASLMADAKQYDSKGDEKAALIQLKNAATKDPANGEVRLLLADLYLRLGDPVSAEKEARKATELQIPAERTAAPLARALVQQGQAQKALDSTAAMAEGNDAQVLAARGAAFLMLTERDKAREAFEAALAKAPGQAEALIGMARLAASGKDLDGAGKLMDQAIAANPKNADVLLFKANLLRAQNNATGALAALDQAIALRPTLVSALLERANIYIDQQKFDLAKADIAAARKNAPGSLAPVYSQAVLDFTQKDYRTANDNVQKILSKIPDNMPALLLAGAVEMNLGSFKQAEQHLSAYLQAFPDNAYARKMLAQAQLNSADTASAQATLAPLLTHGSDDVQTLALAGETAMRARDFAKASDYFGKASTIKPDMAVLRTSRGLSMLAQGEQEKGLEELEKATALDPKSERAGLALVRSEMSLKHFDKALAAVNALIAAHPGDAEVYVMQGGVYLGKGDAAAARASFEKAASLKPDFLNPVLNLARLDVAAKKPDAARARLVAFSEKNKTIDVLMALAALAQSRKRPQEATTWLEKAVAEFPNEVQPGVQLVNQFIATKQAPKAVLLARKLQVANPTNPDLLDVLARSQLASDDANGALETYGKLAALLPKSAAVQMRLAAVHMRLKKPEAAAEDVKRALAIEPNNTSAQLGQIELSIEANKPDEAIQLARNMQKAAPKAPLAYMVEGDIFMSQKKYDAAVKAYEQGDGLAKSSASLAKVATGLRAAGKSKEAEARLTSWLGTHPDDAMAGLMLGELLLERKDFKGASASFERIARNSPDNPGVLNNLAWTYLQLKDARALSTAEQALKLAPGSSMVQDTLGWILAEKGDTARALPLLQKSGAAPEASPEMRYHLGVVLAKSGDKKGAREVLQKAVDSGQPFAQSDEAKSLLKTL